MSRSASKLLVVSALAAIVAPAAAQDLPGKVKSGGELAIESRVFSGGGDDRTRDRGLGLFGRYEWEHQHGVLQERFRAFGRVDRYDPKRNLFKVEEAFIQYKKDRLRVRLGADIVNWSATEAFHPADIINARNLDSDIESFEKIGEPMLAMQLGLLEATTLQVLLMPMYTKSVFPSPRSRLNFASPGIDLQDRARLFDRHGRLTSSRSGAQAAIRVQQQIGSAEVSVHVLEHMDRLQALPALDTSEGLPALVFQTERQVGMTYQQAFANGILAKFEATYGRFVQPSDPVAAAQGAHLAFAGAPFPNRNHATYAAGLEYTLEHGWASSTLVLEAQTVAGIAKELWPSVNLFPRNVLLGYRLAVSSQEGRELRVALIVNVDQSEQRFLNLVYKQRLGEQFTIEGGLRVFRGRDVPAPIGFDALAHGSHVFLNLVRHF